MIFSYNGKTKNKLTNNITFVKLIITKNNAKKKKFDTYEEIVNFLLMILRIPIDNNKLVAINPGIDPTKKSQVKPRKNINQYDKLIFKYIIQ